MFSGVIDRYKYYCLINGAESPFEMEQIEREWAGPGRPIYLLWLLDHLRRWEKERGGKEGEFLTAEEQREFDGWLHKRIVGGC